MKKDVSKEQKEILKGVYDCEPSSALPEIDGILRSIRDYDPDQISLALGDVGRGLQRFSADVDLDSPHPDLVSTIFKDLNGDFGIVLQDILKIITTCEGLSRTLLDSLNDVLIYARRRCSYAHTLDSPFVDQCNIRFVGSREQRDEIRGLRVTQTIEMPDLTPPKTSNFSDLHRNNSRYQKDIIEAEKRLQHFEGMGLSSMSENIKESIQSMKGEGSDSYYGFNKVNLVSMAAILAESMRYKLDERFYRVTRHHFDGYNFWYMKVGDKDLISLMDGETWYRPQMYFHHELLDFASDEIKELINFLEEFPEIGGLPLFDRYVVVVPGLDFPNDWQYPPYRFLTMQGAEFLSMDLAAAQDMLNKELVAGNYLNCALLGERAGEHYFISYWM